MHRNVNLLRGEVEQQADQESAGEFLQIFDSVDENSDSGDSGDDGEFDFKATRRDLRDRSDSLRRKLRHRRHQLRVQEKKAAHANPHYWRLHLHDALLLSLTGVKGAITLAVVLTIPMTLLDGVTPFPERDLIIFLASGVIVLSLLAANFLVPLIAPKKAEQIQPQAEINAILDIYRQVISTLIAKSTPQTKIATEEVVQEYYARIENSKLGNLEIGQEDAKIRKMVIGWEQENTLKLVEDDQISAVTGILYMNQLSRVLARLQHHNAIGWELKAVGKQIVYGFRQLRKRRQDARKLKSITSKERKRTVLETRGLAISNYQYAIVKLEEYISDSEASRSLVKLTILELERRVSRLQNPRELLRGNGGQREDILLKVEAQAMDIERQSINMAAECNKISRATAKELLDNVAIMELDIEEQLN
jgi:CPA1 family monovalent cation:H+ antiporter